MDKEIKVLIEEQTLKWFPYIGPNYSLSKEKILIIGESHYYQNESDLIAHQYTDFTSKQFDNNFNKKKVKFYSNLTRLFDNRDKESFAFYNFIQREMKSNKSRPSKVDFENGWSTFFHLIDIIKPRKVVFLSISAGNHFKKLGKPIAINKGWTQNFHTREEEIGRSKSREISISKNNYIIELYFIQHPSSFFPLEKWKAYLNKKL